MPTLIEVLLSEAGKLAMENENLAEGRFRIRLQGGADIEGLVESYTLGEEFVSIRPVTYEDFSFIAWEFLVHVKVEEIASFEYV